MTYDEILLQWREDEMFERHMSGDDEIFPDESLEDFNWRILLSVDCDVDDIKDLLKLEE